MHSRCNDSTTRCACLSWNNELPAPPERHGLASASVGFANYLQLEILGVQYTSVNLEAKKSHQSGMPKEPETELSLVQGHRARSNRLPTPCMRTVCRRALPHLGVKVKAGCFKDFRAENGPSQGQNLALTVSFVPNSLDRGCD